MVDMAPLSGCEQPRRSITASEAPTASPDSKRAGSAQMMLNEGRGGKAQHFVFMQNPVAQAISGLENECRRRNTDPHQHLRR